MGMQFGRIYEFLPKIHVSGDFLEIGTECGDNSTFIFASLADKFNKTLYSVDIDSNKIDSIRSKITTLPFNLPVEFFISSGEEFLEKNTHLKFSIALLDNFDWTWDYRSTDDHTNDQRSTYSNKFNIQLTNLNSQIAHLVQAIKLVPMLTEESIVICDDTFWLEAQQIYSGKCSSAIPFLISQGFTPVDDTSGVFMIRTKS
jgi:hypothetical protein